MYWTIKSLNDWMIYCGVQSTLILGEHQTMQLQAQRMSVVTPEQYALLIQTDTNSTIQVYCAVQDGGSSLEIHFDMTDIEPHVIQSLLTSAAWKRAIHSFHMVCTKSYVSEGVHMPTWGGIPIQLREIERESDIQCQLLFMEPDQSVKNIRLTLTTIDVGDVAFAGYDLTGDRTVINRIYPRDIYQVANDFLHVTYGA
jgi:hypothetical protein